MIKKGDVMFRRGQFHHTLLVTDPMGFQDANYMRRPDADQSIEVIHAASIDTAVLREVIDISMSESAGNSFTFYRPNTLSLANGVEFALLWAHYRGPTGKVAKKTAKVPITRYSYGQTTALGADKSRYSGVQHALHTGQSPPFEFDALYRAFKWASRQRKGFSENRGTTCCAFVTACFQAAAVDHYAQNQGNIVKGLALLRELRGDKLPLEERELSHIEVGAKKKLIALSALREHANPGGFHKAFGVNDYCKFVTREIHGLEMTIEDLFPPAILVDAKFNYSSNFEKMVATRGSGFVKIL